MLARYAQLAVLPTEMNERLRSRATRQFESEVTLLPPRAKITDRSGRTLAVSILHPSLLQFPKDYPTTAPLLKTLQSKSKFL